MEDMPKLLVQITEEQAFWLSSQTAKFRGKSAVVRDLIDTARQGLTTVANLPAYCVGAGNSLETSQTQVHPSNEADLVRSASEGQEVLKDLSPQSVVGEGIGKGVQREGERKGVAWKKIPPPVLECHLDLILAFWDHKAGAKSEAAWKLLMTELCKIQERYGERIVRDQLELAAANRFKSITLKNYEQFGAVAATPKQANQRKPLADLQAEVDAWPTQSLW